jgi:hypothetical protein
MFLFVIWGRKHSSASGQELSSLHCWSVVCAATSTPGTFPVAPESATAARHRWPAAPQAPSLLVGDSGSSRAKAALLAQKASLRPQPNLHLCRGTVPFHLDGLKGHQRSPFLVLLIPHPPVRWDIAAVADCIASIAGRAAASRTTADTR